VLNILIDKNYEIDELGVQIDTLNNVNKRLRRENTDLNQEALDLENKIHLMDKMYKSMQLTYDKASENLLKSQITQKDNQINSLENTILEIQKDFENFKEHTKETNKQIANDVSTDSFWLTNFEIETPERTPMAYILDEEKQVQLDSVNDSDIIEDVNNWEVRKRNIQASQCDVNPNVSDFAHPPDTTNSSSYTMLATLALLGSLTFSIIFYLLVIL
jgi:chromosome segregation ATPase